MRPVTLIYCLRPNEVLLGMKKRGFGAGKLNGYGGKVHAGEDILSAAARELLEEARLHVEREDLEKVAEIDFFFRDIPKEKGWDQTGHVYFTRRWRGEPQETEEMKPEWHRLDVLPYSRMWIDDEYWLPTVLEGKKIRASITFGGNGESVVDYQVQVVSSF